jgi:hypothetical protein
VQKRVEALLVAPNSLFTDRRVQITTLAARHVVRCIPCASLPTSVD